MKEAAWACEDDTVCKAGIIQVMGAKVCRQLLHDPLLNIVRSLP